MNVVVWVAAALVLHPVVEEGTTLRLAASDTDGHAVRWVLDGNVLGNTTGNQTLSVHVPPGRHEVWASTSFEGEWRIAVRPVAAESDDGLHYVQGWSARSFGDDTPRPVWPLWVLFAGMVAMLHGGRGPKRP